MKNPTPGLLKAKIEARVSEDLSRRIDAWIAARPEPRPNRPEAVRRMVAAALGKARKAAAVKSPPPSDAFLRAKSRGRR
jgi:hypothetical protein